MAYTTNISPGAPPLLWSNIDEAFKKINQNFTELQLYLSDSTITPIDLTNLYTDLSPGDSSEFSLGSITKRWRGVFTSEYSTVPGNELNGLWAGNAQIKGRGFTINLPENSTIGGDPETGIDTQLIIDPEKTFFKSINVDSVSTITAPEFNSILNINSGTAISLTSNPSTQTLTINNSGVTSLVSSNGISISSASGDVTLSNTGVLSLGPVIALPSGLLAGSGISVNNSTGNVTITNTGILSVASGFGITVSTDTSTGVATISNSAPAQVTFRDFVINGDVGDPIQADSISDSFFLDSGYGIIFTKNTSQDRLSIEWNQRSDIIGSVFADDSTLLVDAVNGRIVAPVFANVTGNLLGNVTGNVIGNVDGELTGSVFSDSSTMLVDGTNGTVVGPIRNNIVDIKVFGGSSNQVISTDGSGNLSFISLPSLGNITFSGNVIDSADSSSIVFQPRVDFNSDVVVENDLTVRNVLTVQGRIAGYTSTAELKSIVAASTDFNNFKTRIAAL